MPPPPPAAGGWRGGPATAGLNYNHNANTSSCHSNLISRQHACSLQTSVAQLGGVRGVSWPPPPPPNCLEGAAPTWTFLLWLACTENPFRRGLLRNDVMGPVFRQHSLRVLYHVWYLRLGPGPEDRRRGACFGNRFFWKGPVSQLQ